MKWRKLGKNGPVVSALGLGCMGLSDLYGPTDEKSAEKVIQEAYEQGITFFDTADMYGKGANEQLLGKVIKSFRDKIVIATKCGLEHIPDGLRINNNPDYIKTACANSLKRLGIDSIDLYFLHRHNPEAPIEESMEVMLDLVEEGKVKRVGLSEVSAETIQRAHAILGGTLIAVQSEYSIMNPLTAEMVLPTCRALGLAFVAFSPLTRGLLSGKIRDATVFAESSVFDFRSIAPQFQKEALKNNLRLVEALEELAQQKTCTVAQLSLAWLLAQGDDIIPIPGTKRHDYLQENIGSLDVNLSSEDLAFIGEKMKEHPIQGARLPEALKDFNWHP